ncbi:peptidase M48, Ste24p [Caldicellulosiruptor saccharolyticus DSM 8903]|uniref:Peptidase M48, Ste24p n=1 Tax=Caldicellulosiruptor saccharolyticus (strain ATCC 43494 / DSM 8903 / Tp8T 6331) TaxID=351627 RepID=A4XH80_CALS8|nr:M56 family metallopeptidase [Caldicellulosiruptor saccharolyticus]ABP66265.1 peptidase M48, Ste24p [Caldicellulosiruptor saccharolyticus DSM 8903]
MVWIRILGLDLACIALYIIIMHIIKNYIILSFQNSKNKEEAAAKLNTFFIWSIFVVSTAIGALAGFSVAAILKVKGLREFTLFMILLAFEIYVVIMFFTNKIHEKIFDQKLKSLFVIRQFVVVSLGLIVMLFIVLIPILANLKTDDYKYTYLLPISIFIGFYLFWLIFLNLQYPKKELKIDEYPFIKEVLKKFNFEDIKVILLETMGQKFANLFAAGVFKPQLLITSYALENLKEDQLAAIMVHEIGHIKRNHVRKILLGWIIAVFYYLAFVFGLESLTSYFVKSNVSFVLFILAILLVGTTQFFMLVSYISRIAEIEADIFVLKSGVDKEIYENALKSIYALNYIKSDVSKPLEKIQSHPSLKKRIQILTDAEKTQYKEYYLPFKKVYSMLLAAIVVLFSSYITFGILLPNNNLIKDSANIEKIKLIKYVPAPSEGSGNGNKVNLRVEKNITDIKEIQSILRCISKTKTKSDFANTLFKRDYEIEIYKKSSQPTIYSFSSSSGVIMKYVLAENFVKEGSRPWVGVNKGLGKVISKYFNNIEN